MAMQQTNSSFSKKLGARVPQANAEHKDKPIDTGMKRLPAGIKNGIAKLQFMYTKEQDKEDGKVPKGENFFRASAAVMGKLLIGPNGPVLVKDHDGENIEGMTIAVIIPLCDVPAKGDFGKPKSFEENWYEFQNLFKVLSNGSIVCQETPQTDPTGQKTEAFYFAAMVALTNPKHPIYVEFSTREWKAPKRTTETQEQYDKREAMVFETWHGLAQLPTSAQYDPAAGITQTAPTPTQSHHMDLPPTRVATPAPTDGPPSQHQPDGDGEYFDKAEVNSLVEVAMSDPNSETADGAAATSQLEEMAWQRGWTKEQTAAAKDWSEVGNMALVSPASHPTTGGITATPFTDGQPAVGSRWMYAKRTKEGVKYKDNKGKEFPPQECEVIAVNSEAKTVILKTVHDGKDVTDIRTKKPVDVKFEWLEQAPPY